VAQSGPGVALGRPSTRRAIPCRCRVVIPGSAPTGLPIPRDLVSRFDTTAYKATVPRLCPCHTAPGSRAPARSKARPAEERSTDLV
jgi:hypothetical protein